MKKSTAVEVLPTKPGTPFAGGLYVARFFDGITPYALIVAPKAEGELDSVTHADAVKQTKALRIGGHKDWRLPTRVQALLMFETRKKLKKADGFEETWYWTAEQHASDSDYAWGQGFRYGTQNDNRKSNELRARAVRRIPI